MKYLIALLLCSVPCIAQTDLKTERLQKIQAVHTIFVDGNNVGALKAREQIEKGKTCFTLALKAADADAVFAVGTDSQMEDARWGIRDYIVTGTLTNKDGELLWSQNSRFGDAPFSNGGKEAAKILVHMLKREACEGKRR